MLRFVTHKLWVFHRLNAFKLTVMPCYNHTSSMISVNDEKYNQLLRYMPSLTPWVWDSRVFAPSHAKKKNTKMCHFKSEKTEKTEENEVFYVWKRYRCVIYIYILYIYTYIARTINETRLICFFPSFQFPWALSHCRYNPFINSFKFYSFC